MGEWLTEHQILILLILGSYAFSAGSWGWAWMLYIRLSAQIEKLANNHMAHLDARIRELERRLGIVPPQD